MFARLGGGVVVCGLGSSADRMTSQPSVQLLLFGGLRGLVGHAETTFPLAEVCTAKQLLERVIETWPAIAPHRSAVRVAVNGEYARDDDPVRPGDEVALIPPVAGGC